MIAIIAGGGVVLGAIAIVFGKRGVWVASLVFLIALVLVPVGAGWLVYEGSRAEAPQVVSDRSHLIGRRVRPELMACDAEARSKAYDPEAQGRLIYACMIAKGWRYDDWWAIVY